MFFVLRFNNCKCLKIWNTLFEENISNIFLSHFMQKIFPPLLTCRSIKITHLMCSSSTTTTCSAVMNHTDRSNSVPFTPPAVRPSVSHQNRPARNLSPQSLGRILRPVSNREILAKTLPTRFVAQFKMKWISSSDLKTNKPQTAILTRARATPWCSVPTPESILPKRICKRSRPRCALPTRCGVSRLLSRKREHVPAWIDAGYSNGTRKIGARDVILDFLKHFFTWCVFDKTFLIWFTKSHKKHVANLDFFF